MRPFTRSLLALIGLCGTLSPSVADELVKAPFANSALTKEQIAAWNFYIADESSQFGCSYGDDARLTDDPTALLTKLSAREPMDPVKLTLRTYLGLSDAVRQLVTRNAYIASMTCEKVYIAGDELIGMPAVPFEEYTSILDEKLKANPRIRDHVPFIRSVKVASMDARWFWTFYALDADHIRLLGFDYQRLEGIANALPGDYGEVTPQNVFLRIYQKVFNNGIYVKTSDRCKGDPAEPSRDLMVFKNLAGETVQLFYKAAKVRFDGKWSVSPTVNKDGVSVTDSKPIEKPMNPYFNVTRGMRIYAATENRECK